MDGKALVLDDSGVVGGNEVFKDRGTGSTWQQSSLEAINGPLKGKHLKLYPFLLTNWGEWHKLHPATLVLKPLSGYAERIPRMNQMIAAGVLDSAPAPKGVLRNDTRLKPHARILGLDVKDASEAFPVEALSRESVVEVELGGEPVVVVHQDSSDTTTAFVARADGRTLHFEAAANGSSTELVDRETKSRWSPYGTCTAGRLKGARLSPLILEPEYWFAWSEFHAGTKVYGR